MKRFLLLVLYFAMDPGLARCQSAIGLPVIRSYTHADYHAAIETWDIGQDDRGVLYFANNDGLLTFDGSYWKTYPLPNKAAIKSLAIDRQGRIFVGGTDEIGYFAPGPRGMLSYHSLKDGLPPIARQFADVWNIVIYGDAVFFRTNEAIFEWDAPPTPPVTASPGKMQVFDTPSAWQMMMQAGTQLFAADKEKGLFIYRNHHWEPLCGDKPLHITSVMEYNKDTLLVTSQKNGLFLLSGKTLTPKPTGIDEALKNNLINTGKKLGDDRYALGTATGGVFIIDGKGNVIERFSNAEGLPGNNIWAMTIDREGNLWLGLQNGIALVHYATSIRLIKPVRDNQLSGNTALIFHHRLYVGTSNGLYSLALDPAIHDFSQSSTPVQNISQSTPTSDISQLQGRFTEVENTRGQIWGLAAVGNDLLVAHQDGASVIKDGKTWPVLTRYGVWSFLPLTGRVIAGTYTGLVTIADSNGYWREQGKVNSLYESLPVTADDGRQTVWASHPYRGVFRNPLSGSFTHYGVDKGLPSERNIHLTAWKGKILAATIKGIYEYDPAADKFMVSAAFTPIFGDTSVEYLHSDGDGNIWFISSQRVGVIDYSKPSGPTPWSVIYFPGLKGQTIKGTPMIYPYDKENIFIGSNNGLFHLNYSRYLESAGKISVLLGTIKAIAEKDSLLYGGYAGDTQAETKLPNHWSSFHFEYTAPLFNQPDAVEYSYQLEGFDRNWSDWSPRPEKDYTNLPQGKYRFLVRARDNRGNVSSPAAFSFIVNPAWYQTGWAYIGYLLLGLGLLYLIRQQQRRRLLLHQKKYEEEQARRNYLLSLERDRKEKDQQLATVTMHLVERGGILSGIRDELTAVIKRLNILNLSHEFRPVFRMINDTEKSDEDWNRFAIYFDEVHNNFLSTLKTKFPQLSATDLKLCAYLRLNLSSKEIAQLMNISLKGVEVSRYRLRKKLGLATEINLNDFLGKVSPYMDH